ncbi:GDPGTP exchange factor Sec2p [Ceraceosorus bombacis]|uniref:GDPGTP exchange factor Sec2p n=1 Tax=Ceraceosorus bombacis TaxID=401625 RepID=A0A0P1BC43_9BASI|nr:GDPGTP exchange factor Sec2p [Ceraceosorus bombacis]
MTSFINDDTPTAPSQPRFKAARSQAGPSDADTRQPQARETDQFALSPSQAAKGLGLSFGLPISSASAMSHSPSSRDDEDHSGPTALRSSVDQRSDSGGSAAQIYPALREGARSPTSFPYYDAKRRPTLSHSSSRSGQGKTRSNSRPSISSRRGARSPGWESDIGPQLDLALSFVNGGPRTNGTNASITSPSSQKFAMSPLARSEGDLSRGNSSLKVRAADAIEAAEIEVIDALAAMGRVIPSSSRGDRRSSDRDGPPSANADPEMVMSSLRSLAGLTLGQGSRSKSSNSVASMESSGSGGSAGSASIITWGDALQHSQSSRAIVRKRSFAEELVSSDAQHMAHYRTSEAARAQASTPSTGRRSATPASGLLTSASTPEGALGRISLPDVGPSAAIDTTDEFVGSHSELAAHSAALDVRRDSAKSEEEQEILLSQIGHDPPGHSTRCSGEIDRTAHELPSLERARQRREMDATERVKQQAAVRQNEAQMAALKAGLRYLIEVQDDSHRRRIAAEDALASVIAKAASSPPVEETRLPSGSGPSLSKSTDTLPWLTSTVSVASRASDSAATQPQGRSRSRSILKTIASKMPLSLQGGSSAQAYVADESSAQLASGLCGPSNRLSVLPGGTFSLQANKHQGQAEIAAALSRYTDSQGSHSRKGAKSSASTSSQKAESIRPLSVSQPWTAGWDVMSYDSGKTAGSIDLSARTAIYPDSHASARGSGQVLPSIAGNEDVTSLRVALSQSRLALANLEQEKRRQDEETEELTNRVFIEAQDMVRTERVRANALQREVDSLRAQLTKKTLKGAGGAAIEAGASDDSEADMMAAVKEAALACAEAEQDAATLRDEMEAMSSRCQVLEEALYHAVAAVAQTRLQEADGALKDDFDTVAAQLWAAAEQSSSADTAMATLPTVAIGSPASQDGHNRVDLIAQQPSMASLGQSASISGADARQPEALSDSGPDMPGSLLGAQHSEIRSPDGLRDSTAPYHRKSSLDVPGRHSTESVSSFYSAVAGKTPAPGSAASDDEDDGEVVETLDQSDVPALTRHPLRGAAPYLDSPVSPPSAGEPLSSPTSCGNTNAAANQLLCTSAPQAAEAHEKSSVKEPAFARPRATPLKSLVLERPASLGIEIGRRLERNASLTSPGLDRLPRSSLASPLIGPGSPRGLPPRPPEPSSPLPAPPQDQPAPPRGGAPSDFATPLRQASNSESGQLWRFSDLSLLHAASEDSQSLREPPPSFTTRSSTAASKLPTPELQRTENSRVATRTAVLRGNQAQDISADEPSQDPGTRAGAAPISIASPASSALSREDLSSPHLDPLHRLPTRSSTEDEYNSAFDDTQIKVISESTTSSSARGQPRAHAFPRVESIETSSPPEDFGAAERASPERLKKSAGPSPVPQLASVSAPSTRNTKSPTLTSKSSVRSLASTDTSAAQGGRKHAVRGSANLLHSARGRRPRYNSRGSSSASLSRNRGTSISSSNVAYHSDIKPARPSGLMESSSASSILNSAARWTADAAKTLPPTRGVAGSSLYSVSSSGSRQSSVLPSISAASNTSHGTSQDPDTNSISSGSAGHQRSEGQQHNTKDLPAGFSRRRNYGAQVKDSAVQSDFKFQLPRIR